MNDYEAREKELRDAVMSARHDALGHVLITTAAQKGAALDALLTFVRLRAVASVPCQPGVPCEPCEAKAELDALMKEAP